MIIKEVFLDSEKNKIKAFLKRFDLDLDLDVTETFYVEEEGVVIATVSLSNYIIKCLAVDEDYRGENLAVALVGDAINRLLARHQTFYQVFTKLIYRDIFLNLGLRLVIETKNVAVLESSAYPITQYLTDLKKQLNLATLDIGAIVVNCNPMTLGHLYLIEAAAKNHARLLLFVLQEERSLFTYPERFELVKLGTQHLTNVLVLPSSPYLVSNLTFPSYFMKEESARNSEYAHLDAEIFKQYFMPILGIRRRYIGTETHPTMLAYNQALKDVLGDGLLEIQRLQKDGKDISASMVRALISKQEVESALEFVPKAARARLREICLQKFKTK